MTPTHPAHPPGVPPARVGLAADREAAEMLAALARAAGSEVVAAADVPGLAVPDGVEGRPGLAGTVDVVFVARPPGEVRATLRALGLSPSDRVVLLARGFEPGTGLRLSRLVEAESACLRVGVLAGPLLPGEVRRRSPSAVVCASPFHELGEIVSRALHSPLCRVYPSDDLLGVELAGALAEVVAVALGAARGLGHGVGTQALVITRGIAEGSRLGARHGADPRSFAGLAFAGELVACMGLADHPAVHRGLALARGETDPELAEVCGRLLAVSRDLPITGAVQRVARGEVKAADALAALVARDVRDELDR